MAPVGERGIAVGEARGIAVIVKRMHKNGFTAEQIAAATDTSKRWKPSWQAENRNLRDMKFLIYIYTKFHITKL